MTVRELIKCLETCGDLDKKVAIVIEILGGTEEGQDALLREVIGVKENKEMVGII